MKYLLAASVPPFDSFDFSDNPEQLDDLKKLWADKTLGGGSIVEPLSFKTTPSIETPMLKLIDDLKTNDLLHVQNVQESKANKFYDVWILDTNTNSDNQ
jgi:hypothetical protein